MYLPSIQFNTQNSQNMTAIVRPAAQNCNKIRGIIGEYTPEQCVAMRKKATAYASKTVDRTDDGTLTRDDKEAWWDYLSHYLPNHFELAMALKTGAYDSVLERTLSIHDFTYNQLFKIYGLPTVHTKNHAIVIDDKEAVKMLEKVDYEKRKRIYNLCHQDDNFHKWKEYQYIHSQDGKCAWCEKPVAYSDTQVDHIKPLRFGGKNVSWNLVIACKCCNRKKCADKTGWNNNKTKNNSEPNAKPSWIKENKHADLWRDILKTAKAKKEAEEHNR